MGAFHAYDIRGIYNVDFDRETAYKVGYFVPGLLEADRVLVGRDARVSSPEIHEYLVKGILDSGADVYDLGLSSTPMVYFATARHGFKASVQITASHNPKEYNGMKVSRENALPVGLDAGLGRIREWIEEGRPTPVASRRGTIHNFDIYSEYIEFLSGFKGDYSDLKIAMDISNGMAALYVKDLFGLQPYYLYDSLDGTFPNHEANPLIPENSAALRALVREKGCDAGVIFDGDADRVMFIDDKGEFISPDLIIALLGDWFVKEKGQKGIVLQDIRSSKSVAEALVPQGCEVATWKVGRAFAAPRLREIGGIWGGELAGHYYFRDFFYSDSGLLASLLVMRIVASLKKEGSSLSERVAGLRRYCNSGEINFKLERKSEAMDAVRDFFTKEEKPSAMYDFDGYRVEFPNWWFNIRPSNTEPYLRFICEASNERLLAEKVEKAREIISSLS